MVRRRVYLHHIRCPDCGSSRMRSAALNGLQIGKRYRFRCAVINESDAFWRNRPTLYLACFESV